MFNIIIHHSEKPVLILPLTCTLPDLYRSRILLTQRN